MANERFTVIERETYSSGRKFWQIMDRKAGRRSTDVQSVGTMYDRDKAEKLVYLMNAFPSYLWPIPYTEHDDQ